MTTPPPSADDDGMSPEVPPPGCPAHRGGGGLVELHDPSAVANHEATDERLRKLYGNVAPVALPGGVTAWLVLGYREILEVTGNPRLYTRDTRQWSGVEQLTPTHPLTALLAPQKLCVFADGDEHHELRGAITRTLGEFESRSVRRLVEMYSNQLIDQFPNPDRGLSDGVRHVDLVTAWAEQLPMMILAHLAGLPVETAPRLVKLCQDVMGGTEEAQHSHREMTVLLEDLVEQNRRWNMERPRNNVTAKLLERFQGDRERTREHVRLLLIAGNQTTVSLMSSLLRYVLTSRAFRSEVRGGHKTIAGALEEVSWYEPPLRRSFHRVATNDTHLPNNGGTFIKKGDLLVLGLAAGNNDPAIRSADEPLDGNRAHLAYGGAGPHECPGQGIARIIVETGVDHLLDALWQLELDGPEEELRWEASFAQRRPANLPVRCTLNPVRPGRTRSAHSAPLPKSVPQSAGAMPAAAVPSSAAPEPAGGRGKLRKILGS
ncbi:cytochrome P450 [Streptomyces nanshensis]|nr:cytochrome P450 [Streptomyces nanshensis]